jgi:uncharacterized protein YndB with AHSA1/START domain
VGLDIVRRMIEVKEQISAVRRVVGTRVLEAGEARTVTVSRTYETPLADLWDACTNPERIPRWFLPVSGELRLGGHYQLEGNAGGTVERCDPPNGFAATWEYGGEVSWIELQLTEEGAGRTRFELLHIAHVDDTKWAEFGPGAVGVGWDLAVYGLTMHLASGEAVAGEAGMAWMMSEEGRQFMAEANDRWYEADVAAGRDPAAARAAADRTIAAYRGE